MITKASAQSPSNAHTEDKTGRPTKCFIIINQISMKFYCLYRCMNNEIFPKGWFLQHHILRILKQPFFFSWPQNAQLPRPIVIPHSCLFLFNTGLKSENTTNILMVSFIIPRFLLRKEPEVQISFTSCGWATILLCSQLCIRNIPFLPII